MRLTRQVIRSSYAACHRLARRSRSNFYPCFLGLPPAKHKAMDALYAFMRRTDDLADDPQPVDRRGQAIVEWRAALERALQGELDLPGHRPDQAALIANHADSAGRDLLPALVDVVEQYQIPPKYLHAVIDGVEMDLRQQRYETFDELEDYCRRVASAVGMACIYVWGFRGPDALEPARKCGIALQLTNILRDLKEDAQRDRVYLPLEDLRKCGYSVEDLIQGVADERFGRLMEMEINRAERFYCEGAQLIQWLEPDGRRVFGMMISTYHALLKKIKRRPGEVLRGRIRLSRAKKLQIAARWLLLPPRPAALP